MGKNNLRRWLIPIGLGAIILASGYAGKASNVALAENSPTITPIVLSASHTQITINDASLNTAVRKLLGKTETALLYADDFLNHEDFKAVTTTDPESGVTTTTAKNYQLNLSNTGITDIRELCKFAFPETLQGINLSGNGIKIEHLDNINTLINATPSTPIIIGEDTFEPACDFSQIIKKVNLNNNKIDLATISNTHLNNKKFLFGIQNFDKLNSAHFVQLGTTEPMYYIRSDDAEFLGDEHYLTFSFIFEFSTEINSVVNKVYNTPTKLLDLSAYSRPTGRMSISVISLPSSPTAYFSGYEFSQEFILFDIKMKDDFTVERKSLLNLNIVNGKPTENCPLIVDGFGDSLIIEYNSPSTNNITTAENKNYVNISLTYQGQKISVPVEFNVIDTIEPVIKLIGSNYTYASKNKTFKDPGYTAYDPATEGAETGDDLSSMVRTTSTVKITELGVYTITYTVSDQAGNSTTVTRTVEIQEMALDRINLRTNTENITLGEDIILVVQPDSGINVSNYSNLKYYWYLNGTLFTTTIGDSTSGKSTTTINLTDAGTAEIKVKLVAKQNANGAEIEVFSDALELRLDPQLRNNDPLILAASIALVALIVVIIIVALVKYQKSKGKTTGRHKNFKKGKAGKIPASSSDQPQIQVIKNYNPANNNGNPNGGGDSGGGNQNFRLPENNQNNNGRDI